MLVISLGSARNMLLKQFCACVAVMVVTYIHFQFVAQNLSLPAATCFGHRTWASSGRYKLHTCVQHILQAVTRKLKMYWCLVSSEGRRPLGRHRRRWGNIKIDILEVGWGGMDWIELTQDTDRWRAVVNAVMKLRVP
jgi:hypothetical protein